MSIKKPIKAPSDPITNDELRRLKYPIVGSPKLDGFRCIVDGEPLTSSMKPWPNRFIRETLSDPKYHGLDGEILVGEPNGPDPFFATSGPVRRYDGKPDFFFYVFDRWIDGNLSYHDRWIKWSAPKIGRLIVLEQRLLHSPEEVLEYEEEMLNDGFEGAMIRSLDGRYKEGRCSFREMNIFKRKPFVECEAEIIEVIEGLENLNVPKMNETGNMRRSSHKENKRPKGTLGSFKLRSVLWVSSFHASTGEGFTAERKQEIWDHREEYIGQIATVKYQKYGSRDAPRLPNVIKIRPKFDVE